jgi:hypothetical protein
MDLHKRLLLFFVLLFSISGFTQSLSYDPNHLYTIGELKSDLQFLRKNWKRNIPIYIYTHQRLKWICFWTAYTTA